MRRAALALLLAAVGCAGCGGDSGAAGTTVDVFAAASLKAPFTRLEERFEAQQPGVDVRLNLGGSSDLAAQIREGAPADVFASADTRTMEGLGDLAESPEAFATNTLAIAVPPDNPAGVRSFEDLADDGVRLVTCAPAVPCGAATTQAAAKAGLTLEPVSEEQSVTDVLGKVVSGEADAGLVYVTDVKAAGDAVTGLPLPDNARVVNTYPITTVAGADQPELAEDFVALVRAAAGRQVLADAGFGAP